MLLKTGWWDVNEAIRSYQRLRVGFLGFLYVDCAAFQWEHDAVSSQQDSAALGEAMVVEWMEASALLCRSSSAIRLAERHGEPWGAALNTPSSPSGKRLCGEMISGEQTARHGCGSVLFIVRFSLPGGAVKSFSVLLGKCVT